ncbi:MAG TPA: SCO family protein [Salinimicrobium sp.]|nr:SCO family protein [Salinimicrobium sp.]
MKNYSYIGISFIILIFGIIFIPRIIESIRENKVVESDRLNVKKESSSESREEASLSYIMVNGEKKRIPEFQLVDQHGDTISNEDYKGKVFVVEFFFSTCPSICPIMKDNLIKVQKEFKDNPDFGIASFTIDPVHDTPEVLAKYAEMNGIEHPNWHLLTGDKETIYDIANDGFNIYAGEDPNVAGGFAHSGYFALIDREGNIRSRTDQFGNPIIYYRGSIEQGITVAPGEEEPQTDILIEDIKKLL